MSGKVQSLDSIAPMSQAETSSGNDPVTVEYEQGKKCLENKEYGQAAVALHNALVGYEDKKDENGIANASNQLGKLCVEKGDFEKSLNHFQRALEICDKHYDRMSILAVMHQMVKAHRGLEDNDKALETCLDILDHYHDNRDPQGTVVTLEEMAEIYIAKGENSKAADAFRTISSIHKNFNHSNIAAEYLEKASKLAG